MENKQISFIESIKIMMMNQLKLDNIILKKIGKEKKDVISELKIALQIELMELMNELEVFKFWKENKKNNIEKQKSEFSDCLHFAFSYLLYWFDDDINAFVDIYNECFETLFFTNSIYCKESKNIMILYECIIENIEKSWSSFDVAKSFWISNINDKSLIEKKEKNKLIVSIIVFYLFEMANVLGYSQKDISDIYYKKHTENLERQKNNY